MRKLATAVLSGVVLGALVVPTAAWGTHDLEDFTVYAKITDFEREDNGKEGFSEKDKFTFEADVYDEDADRVGDGKGACVVKELDKEREEFEADCGVLLDLEDGKLKMAGTIDEDDVDDGKVTLPIVKGTDDYDGAEGEATFEPHGRDRHGDDRHGDHGHGDHGDGDHGKGHHPHFAAQGHDDGEKGHDKGHEKGHGHHERSKVIKISVDFD